MEDLERFLSDPRTEYYANEYKRLLKEVEDLSLMSVEEVGDLIKEERKSLDLQLKSIESKMNDIVKDEDSVEEFPNEIILEVRAGAGGDEASIFARNLAEMYKQYSISKDWSFTAVNINENNAGGYKEAGFEIRGRDVYKKLRFETGVHRIQRVPVTEKSGRVHTSTASIAILPIKKRKNIDINPVDLKMEFSRSGGAGGQNVNKVESAVRILHIPTGIDVRCTEARTQLKNRERAMEILLAKIEVEQRSKEDSAYASIRKDQIGTGDRSEKIRTYNILQDRVTDHRLKKSWHGVENILAGSIEDILTFLQEESEKQNK